MAIMMQDEKKIWRNSQTAQPMGRQKNFGPEDDQTLLSGCHLISKIEVTMNLLAGQSPGGHNRLTKFHPLWHQRQCH
jgi:hypothetical protein